MAQRGVSQSTPLSKSVKWTATQEGIKMEVAEYYPYVSEGRKGTRRRARLAKVPIDALIEWIKANGITPRENKTINQLAFAIQTSIYQKGINSNKPVKGKGFGDVVMNQTADYVSENMANEMAEQIADEVVEAMQV